MKFKINDTVKFNIKGADIYGTGRILGRGYVGLCPTWIVELHKRSNFLETIEDKAILIQEGFIELFDNAENTKKVTDSPQKQRQEILEDELKFLNLGKIKIEGKTKDMEFLIRKRIQYLKQQLNQPKTEDENI